MRAFAKTSLLIGFSLCLFSQAGFSGVRPETKSTKRLLRVELPQEDAVELKEINTWLSENVSTEECPDRRYFSIHERNRKARLLGYQVIADCPDAPMPRMSFYFDASQVLIEPEAQ
jgi:hypothetical protein